MERNFEPGDLIMYTWSNGGWSFGVVTDVETSQVKATLLQHFSSSGKDLGHGAVTNPKPLPLRLTTKLPGPEKLGL